MSILQELLNLGLVDIGSDDSRFEKMQLAASALAKRFIEEPALLIPAALIAIDDDVDENVPTFMLVEDLVIAEWNTLRNTHVNRPRQLLRSIVIDALTSVIKESAHISGVVWNTTASPYRHKQARPGKSAPVVDRLIQQAYDIAETEALCRAGMAFPPSKKTEGKKPAGDAITLDLDGKIDEKQVLEDVARAAGPENASGESLRDSNPNWPDTGKLWSNEFVPRMVTALVKAANLGTACLSKSLDSYLLALEERLDDQVRDATQWHASSRMRLDVLWWSESLYSPSLHRGYREFSLPEAAVAAAVDLVTMVPALAPASVCYVLGETVLRLCRILQVEAKQQLESYLQGLSAAKPDFGEALPQSATDKARLPLIDLVGKASTGSKVPPAALRSLTGVDATLELSAAEFSIWVFRDLQARRLVGELG